MSGYKYFRYFNYSPGGEPPPDWPDFPSPEPPNPPDPPTNDCCVKSLGNISVEDIPNYTQGSLQVLGHVEGDACLKWISVTKCEDEQESPPSTTEEPPTEEPPTEEPTTESPGGGTGPGLAG
ncbi:MAG: hypothetical protein EBU90_31725 [Proteobacteria bacterium]|nr:hypothetical protein [Pseudomonadota bacterium]